MTTSSWKVVLEPIDATTWNIRADKTNGDHQGTSFEGSEEEARTYAHETFGKTAKVTANRV